jgi:predicted molibdopterin-dependent oxidoreductase YjgC
MFRRLPDPASAPAAAATRVTLSVDGQPVVAHAGDSVAAALLAAGIVACRSTPVNNVPRAPYCMMGVCFDCLVEIDGQGSRQACMVPVHDGMRVETQRGKRRLDR